jgi:hypothetical protein
MSQVLMKSSQVKSDQKFEVKSSPRLHFQVAGSDQVKSDVLKSGLQIVVKSPMVYNQVWSQV